jgi:O-acetyl-ADP-ribose deacetylase (regulator of RNase III)
MDHDRRTTAPTLESAVRSAMARAREIGATSIAFPALGSGVGGFQLEEGARIIVATVRRELADSPSIGHVVFALRGATTYQAFAQALQEATAMSGAGP